MKPRIMPIGDSITRGSYLDTYAGGPFAGQAIGLAHPAGGGWRKPLQDRLRAAGVDFEFVGELDYGAYGRDGVVDPAFSPRHHGLAGFGNQNILDGGIVPTPQDVLADRNVDEIRVPDIVTVLTRQRPDIILLMSGANGFDAAGRDRLIHTILEHFDGQLFVATIPPQRPPRVGFEQVDAYNASLPATVASLRQAGQSVSLVDIHAALGGDDLLADGVHPTRAGMDTIAATWQAALLAANTNCPGLNYSRGVNNSG